NVLGDSTFETYREPSRVVPIALVFSGANVVSLEREDRLCFFAGSYAYACAHVKAILREEECRIVSVGHEFVVAITNVEEQLRVLLERLDVLEAVGNGRPKSATIPYVVFRRA